MENDAFDRLQAGLREQWSLIGSFNDHPQTMIVVPSMSLDLDCPPTVLQAYEERSLFMLFLLRKPRARIVYVTSMPIAPAVVDYYLGLLPGIVTSQARSRLVTIAVDDGSPRPLTGKILERPRLLARLRREITDPRSTHLVPFNTTDAERELAERLGIPMFAADPRHFSLGTKSGGRALFREADIPFPAGFENLHTRAEVTDALRRLLAERPGLRAAMVKLDQAVSGQGNAVVDVSGLGTAPSPSAIGARLDRMRIEAEGLSVEDFLAKFQDSGGVVEERLVADEIRSPSVQLRNTPLGEVEVLSTHDQLLGGPSGQSYLGCLFPADPAYAVAITRQARAVGELLAKRGVLGRYALDFVAARRAGPAWETFAIEINLRKGGTTHPYLTLEFLTGGDYDADAGVFRAPSGTCKHYVANDHVESPAFRRLTVDDLFEIAVVERFHFDPTTQTGIVYHLVKPVTECGRFGLTAVADSAADADALYRRAVAAVAAAAERE